MIAKCAKCQYVFNTDHYGKQTCPLCGTELMLALPPSPSSSSPEPSIPLPEKENVEFPINSPPGKPTPWEERAQRGLFPALFQTVKLSMVSPVEFFSQMRVDNADGAVSYYWINAGIGVVLSQLWQLLFLGVRSGFGSMNDSPFAASNVSSLMYLITCVLTVLFMPVALFISAGIIHLGALIFKSANNGFNATLRSVAYSSGPYVLAIVPICGGFAASIWALVLVIIGVWKTQRTSGGLAVAAVFVPSVVLGCCVGSSLVVLAMHVLAKI